MKKFTVYDRYSGKILRTGSCPEDGLEIQANESDGEAILVDVIAKDGQIVVNGEIVDIEIDDSAAFNIASLKKEKSLFLNVMCRSEIYLGYKSNALGLIHHYPSNDKDQMNMTASVVDSLNPANDESWVTPFLCSDENGVWDYRLHTREQIQKAGADGKRHILSQLQKNAELQRRIELAESLEELDLIVW